ncbi:hypothetical protein VTO42DRAFT_3122 [Malbranchea cinnamomea]
MERMFSSDGKPAICQACNEPSKWGWVYVCRVERDNAKWQQSRAGQRETAEPEQIKVIKLNDWVIKAINDGHYTDSEIEILLTQRSKVQELIATGNKPPEPPAGDNKSTDSLPSNAKVERGINESPTELSMTFRSFLEHAMRNRIDSLRASPQPPCELQLCHSCFPPGAERTWQSLNEICSGIYDEEVIPSDIFQIPRSAISGARRTGMDQSEMVNSTVKRWTTDSPRWDEITERDPATEGSYSSSKTIEEEVTLSRVSAPDTDETSDCSAREALLKAFASYKRQELGTPRRISRGNWRHSAPATVSNENAPLDQSRPKLTRKPNWAKKGQDSESDERGG